MSRDSFKRARDDILKAAERELRADLAAIAAKWERKRSEIEAAVQSASRVHGGGEDNAKVFIDPAPWGLQNKPVWIGVRAF